MLRILPLTVLFLTYLMAPFLTGVSPCVAETFGSLVSQYQKVRNNDPQVREPVQWVRLMQQFDTFQRNSPKAPEAADALFRGALLAEQVQLHRPSALASVEVVRRFETVPQLYPTSSLADDAALRVAEYLRSSRGMTAEVRKRYEEVQKRFPGTDSAAIAGERLRPSVSGGFSSPKSRSLSPSRRGQGPVIVIDPGHGGEDHGAVGVGGLLEKDVALDISGRLQKLFEERLGATVRLTRSKDEFVPLAQRTQMANDLEAELFISIHNNASERHSLSGFEVYYLDTTDDKASKLLAERENVQHGEAAPTDDLSFMLSDLIQSGKLEESVLLARSISEKLSTLSSRWRSVQSLGVKKGPFYVLVGAHMPCVLVELFFIDHKNDGALLADPKFRQAIAEQLARGVETFLSKRKAKG